MRKFLVGLVLATGLGCTGVQPIGPLAKYMGGKKPETKAVIPGDPPPSTTPRPPAPAALITPGEVSSENPAAAAQQLARELEYDGRTMRSAPQVSVYKGGEKVR
jgi:hypothetical protein